MRQLGLYVSLLLAQLEVSFLFIHLQMIDMKETLALEPDKYALVQTLI